MSFSNMVFHWLWFIINDLLDESPPIPWEKKYSVDTIDPVQ